MKWGWDFNRNLREDDVHVPLSLRKLGARRRGEDIVLISDDEIDLTDPIRFSVQAVEGGTLVETRWYDAKTDNHPRKLHIVTNEENLAEAIGKIVTMELLKR
jgi:hypothetical protein